MSQSNAPLAGVTVVDLGQIYNGPYATFLMARAGAHVIKIEPPGGENMRRRGVVGGAMLPFAMLNSNKHFVTINLKSDGGCDLLRRLAARADIVLENFAPGVMDRLGIGPTALMAANPRLIYAAGSGFGWSGPYREYPAMDLTVQAMSGVMSTTGYPEGPPTKAGPAICDFTAGVHLYGAVMTALYEREKTGKGRFVEVSMLEAVYFSLSSSLGLYYGSDGKGPPRTGNRHAGLAEAPYNVYPASDGWLALICVTDGHWRSLVDAMAQPELADDLRFCTLKARVAHMDVIDELVSGWTCTMTKQRLFELLMQNRVPCAPVRDLGEVMNDPHLHARGALRRVAHPTLGDVILPTGAMRFSDEPLEIVPSKALGADNVAIYCDWLGLDAGEFEALTAEGAI